MIEVTAKARALMADYFKNKPRSPIRIFPKTGGCGIRVLSIAFEEPTPQDEVFAIGESDYVVEREFMRAVKHIKVDSDGIGLLLSGNGYYSTSGCGNCGFMGGCR
jgi:Fe-S cluster assembly iron-binding protein IscA